jgi:hypothetical protein
VEFDACGVGRVCHGHHRGEQTRGEHDEKASTDIWFGQQSGAHDQDRRSSRRNGSSLGTLCLTQKEFCAKHEIASRTLRRWLSKYGADE